MPLRFVKVPRSSTNDALHLAISAATLTKELSNLAQFPPATAAVSVILLIFETIQGVQNNKVACLQLARRCARILLDINEQMEGRWNTAPPSLLKNLEKFEQTLTSIHAFMKVEAEVKWRGRFLRKISIENALVDYNSQLDDAWQSFQIATLINIHHAVSSGAFLGSSRVGQKGSTPHRQGTAPPPYIKPAEANEIPESDSPLEAREFILDKPQPSGSDSGSDSNVIVLPSKYGTATDDTLEDRGFRRYHQSEVRLTGKAAIKDGWWGGSSLAEINGQEALVKRYEGPQAQAARSWLRDIKILQDLYHPNLPQLVGYSQNGAATPFILLSNVRTRVPQALLTNMLNTTGIASCAHLVLRFYRDITDATLYLQQQLNLNDTKAQDFLSEASYRVDGSNTMIIGLPGPKDGVWYTARNYGLTESLKMAVMGMLPNSGSIELKRSNATDPVSVSGGLNHLVTLFRGLLPADTDPPVLPPRAKLLIENGESDHSNPQEISMNLRQIRLSNIEAGMHDHTWYENSGIPANQFAVGDFGYIPKGEDFNQFKRLGNIFQDELGSFPIEHHASGEQWCWENVPPRRIPIEPYDLPEAVKCWPIAVPPHSQIDCQIIHRTSVSRVADAWHFLLKNGLALSDELGIRPGEIILITNAGSAQHFHIRDFSTPMYHGLQRNNGPTPGRPSFGHQTSGFNHWNRQPHLNFHIPHQSSLPIVMYLLTSIDPEFQPYWSHHPVGVAKGSPIPDLRHNWTYRIGWCTGFVNWVQLHLRIF
ncbi:hypothetical protein BD779DRAFT_1516063 [Infundibulicybe gibba]|nr:hypothetical protein BD779DRAFT_1516063 [Infundibulicybe gibba]